MKLLRDKKHRQLHSSTWTYTARPSLQALARPPRVL